MKKEGRKEFAKILPNNLSSNIIIYKFGRKKKIFKILIYL